MLLFYKTRAVLASAPLRRSAQRVLQQRMSAPPQQFATYLSLVHLFQEVPGCRKLCMDEVCVVIKFAYGLAGPVAHW